MAEIRVTVWPGFYGWVTFIELLDAAGILRSWCQDGPHGYAPGHAWATKR